LKSVKKSCAFFEIFNKQNSTKIEEKMWDLYDAWFKLVAPEKKKREFKKFYFHI
jgi:hypothetical protein